MPGDPKPMLGWQTFAAAATMAVRPDRLDGFWALCVAGFLANGTVLLTPWLFRRRSGVPRWFVYALAAAFVLNLIWIPVMSGSVMLPGYWMWLGALGALALVGISLRSRAVRAAPQTTGPSAAG